MVVPRCRYSHHSPLSHCVPCWVTAISPPPIEGGWEGGGIPQPLSLPLRMPLLLWSSHCPRGYHSCLGCRVLIGALVIIGAVGASLLPSSSLVPHPTVVITVGAWWVNVAVGASPLVLVVVPPGCCYRVGAPPQLVLVAVGASLLVVMAVWCPPFILVAMGASSLILVVVWCPLGRHHGCASLVVIAAVSPVIVMAMGAPARPHGRVVPPWSLLSWPCGAPPVVVMAVPGCPHGCATHSSS